MAVNNHLNEKAWTPEAAIHTSQHGTPPNNVPYLGTQSGQIIAPLGSHNLQETIEFVTSETNLVAFVKEAENANPRFKCLQAALENHHRKDEIRQVISYQETHVRPNHSGSVQ